VVAKAKKEKPVVLSWYKDRYQYVVVQRKLLTFITLVSLVGTLGSLLVISYLIPLKSVEPFVIQVDQKSGITQTVDPMTVRELTANEAVNNYFIVQYIRARESYDPINLVQNYNIVRIMSESQHVYPWFVLAVNPNNPESNVARLGTNATRKVRVKSITYLNSQTAQLRVLIEERGESISGTQLHKIVTVKFEYIKMNLNSEERYINPLGFRVTEYRVDEEVMQK
jgi:type IV secretion system protein VirB8